MATKKKTEPPAGPTRPKLLIFHRGHAWTFRTDPAVGWAPQRGIDLRGGEAKALPLAEVAHCSDVKTLVHKACAFYFTDHGYEGQRARRYMAHLVEAFVERFLAAATDNLVLPVETLVEFEQLERKRFETIAFIDADPLTAEQLVLDAAAAEAQSDQAHTDAVAQLNASLEHGSYGHLVQEASDVVATLDALVTARAWATRVRGLLSS